MNNDKSHILRFTMKSTHTGINRLSKKHKITHRHRQRLLERINEYTHV